jgi:glycosyltransferase involved in cell wall biosynthesis
LPDNRKPLVTVAMVTYKSAPYVRMAIESVLASSYTNFELIISDDCSPDNTWDFICEYKDPRIRASRNEKNIGEYPNRNKCIDLAQGGYLIFVDGDDYLFPDALAKCIDYANQFPEFGFILASTGKKSMIYPTLLEPKNCLKIHFFIEPLFNHSFLQAFFKTELLRESNITNDYISGDYHLFLKLASKYNLLLINAPLGWWRVHDQQSSNKLIGVNAILNSINITLELMHAFKYLSEIEKSIILNRQIIHLFKYLVKHPWSVSLKVFKILTHYNFWVRNKNSLTYYDLGLEPPLIKDINRNPYNIKNLV